MTELLKVNNDTQTVSARELHENLNIGTAFKDWFPRMCEYGFVEGEDFCSKMSESTGGRPSKDADISLDMAKQICMIQRTPEGKRVRQYLIDLEKAWNTPEQIFARALRLANETINNLQITVSHQRERIEDMKPKEEFFDAVADSKDAIPMNEVAKVLDFKGYGRNNLFEFLRSKGVLQSNNIPYQRYQDMGWFRVIEQHYPRNGELCISFKTLVYQKGVNGIRKLLVKHLGEITNEERS